MKILHIITALTTGGAQSVLRGLLDYWKSGNDRHQVVSLIEGGPVAQDIRAMGIQVHSLAMASGRADPGALWRLAGAIRTFQPDLIQTWLYHADLMGGLAGRLSGGAPVVWGIHHTLSRDHTMKPATYRVVRLNALLSGVLPARIHCCSRSALESHARFGFRRGKMLVIPNGVDLNRFHPDPAARAGLRDELHIPEDTKLIGMFARDHPQKDHRNLIRAAGLLRKSRTKAHVVLAGEGVDEGNSDLKRWIVAEGLTGAVHLLGLRRDMPRLYAALDLFTLSSSDGEAFPMVLCEAMACGIPCVATDVGDALEIIGDPGRIVPVRDPAALARAWRMILELPGPGYESLGGSERARIRERYALENTAVMYHQLYQEMLS